MKRGILGSVLAFSLLGAVACGGDDADNDEAQNSAEEGDGGSSSGSQGTNNQGGGSSLDGGVSAPSARDARDAGEEDDDRGESDGGPRGRGRDELDGGERGGRGDGGRTRPERPEHDASTREPRTRDGGRPSRDGGPQSPPNP